LLRACQARTVEERTAREAARLRTASGRAGTISAVDAIVVALAETLSDPVILTSDPADLRALAEHAAAAIRVGQT